MLTSAHAPLRCHTRSFRFGGRDSRPLARVLWSSLGLRWPYRPKPRSWRPHRPTACTSVCGERILDTRETTVRAWTTSRPVPIHDALHVRSVVRRLVARLGCREEAPGIDELRLTRHDCGSTTAGSRCRVSCRPRPVRLHSATTSHTRFRTVKTSRAAHVAALPVELDPRQQWIAALTNSPDLVDELFISLRIVTVDHIDRSISEPACGFLTRFARPQPGDNVCAHHC
jgi:hypothetical protein